MRTKTDKIIPPCLKCERCGKTCYPCLPFVLEEGCNVGIFLTPEGFNIGAFPTSEIDKPIPTKQSTDRKYTG